ncbi:MAG: hypothetical protein IPL26_04545 [Leptospiraceae bacterium]|nr:hypothetical protein [Leptospiraceae bacterium]
MKYNLKILENTNELIKSIASGRKPTARCQLLSNVWITQTQSFLFKKEMIM